MKAQRRTRSPHPGVVIESPEGEHTTYRARFVDPDTGKKVRLRLDPLVLGSKEARRAWAIQKSRSIAKRKAELEAGAVRKSGEALSDAIASYFRAHPRLSANTLAAYRAAAGRLETWAAKERIQSVDDLTRRELVRFREALVALPIRAPIVGGKRGARAESGESRSAHTLNRDLRSVRTILGYLVERDTFARLTHDDLRRALKRQAAVVERIDYLRPEQLRALLKAALDHDAQTFAETRAEHAGEGEPGSTARYEAIAPFVAVCLMTGMRAGACLALDWASVHLEPEPGEIVPRGGNLTKRTGVIGLEVSPALRSLLLAMRPKKAAGAVFAQLTPGTLKAAQRRLVKNYGAPDSFTWQVLRVTCGSYLTNAPGIFGAASAYRSAKQLGHSVAVAERHYVGLVRGIPETARTLEAAMRIEAELGQVIDAAQSQRSLVRRA